MTGNNAAPRQRVSPVMAAAQGRTHSTIPERVCEVCLRIRHLTHRPPRPPLVAPLDVLQRCVLQQPVGEPGKRRVSARLLVLQRLARQQQRRARVQHRVVLQRGCVQPKVCEHHVGGGCHFGRQGAELCQWLVGSFEGGGGGRVTHPYRG